MMRATHGARWGLSAVALLGLALASAATTATASPPGHPDLRAELRHGTLLETHGVVDICAVEHLACSHVAVTAGLHSSALLSTERPKGYGARELERAYGLTHAPSADGTITIIDAAAYPKLASDLAVYRRTFGLPACTITSGCLRVMNRFGGKPLPPPTEPLKKFLAEGVAQETSLDVDMASAACPGCRIIVLQVPGRDAKLGGPQHLRTSTSHFGDAVTTAVGLGTRTVSISYGFPSSPFTDTGYPAQALDKLGTAIYASSGDYSYNGTMPAWPETLTTVVSVGGTSLHPADNPRGYREVAWDGAGSSCSPDLGPAVGQPAAVSATCNGARAASDISAMAAPGTGVAVFDSYSPYLHDPPNWIVLGGTSVAAPFVAGISARAPRDASVNGPNVVYGAPRGAFNDVTTGANGTAKACKDDGFSTRVCIAGPGWDGPTGRGTPIGLAPFSS